MMREFDLYVYTRDLDFLGIIDDFTSLRWRRKYFEAGEFELHVALNDNILKFLKEDNILVRSDAKEAGIIESYQIIDDENDLTIKILGRFLSSILDRRIVKKRINFSGTFLLAERTILNEMTPFNRLIIVDNNIDSENVIFQCTYKNVYTYLNKLSKASNIAHRIIPDVENKVFIYENYQGLDRTEDQNINTRYEFSEDKSNLDTSEYTFSAKKKINYILVGGSGEGDDRMVVEVKSGTFTDFDLKEAFINAAQEVKSKNTSDEEYCEILKTKGKENLTDSNENIEISVFEDDYKIGWDLGDIVNIKKESWNIKLKKRITEVEEIYEKEKRNISVVVGAATPETFNNED